MKKIEFHCIILFLLSCCIFSCSRESKTYVITDFGATGDGKTINTSFIKKAVEKCYSNGGGTVIVPSGDYVTGTINLLSNVDLHLEAGAILRGSKDTIDYLKMDAALFNEGYTRYGIIYAADAINVSITGYGEINGNGTSYMNSIDKPHRGRDWDRQFTRQGTAYMPENAIFEDGPVSYFFRPGMMVTFERCENIKVMGVQLNDTPEWTVKLQDCDGAIFSGLSIVTNPLVPNSDGIHCTSSRNVSISDCRIFAGDDAIIVTGFGIGIMPSEAPGKPGLRGNKTGYAENIVISNCILSSRSACIRVGYGQHPIRNLIFSNIVMDVSNRGIGVFARNNSSIENVLFENIFIRTRLHSGHWWGKGEPIHISAIKDDANGNAGSIKGIRFSNIKAVAETGILIYGTAESIVEDVEMNEIELTIQKGKYTTSYGGNFDLRPSASKDMALFMHDIPGLYAQYVKNLSIDGFKLKWKDTLPSFFTNGIEIKNFEGLQIENYRGGPAFQESNLAAIKIVNGKNSNLQNCCLQNQNIIQHNIK